jgi:Uma2 family endonuclease
MQAAPKLTISDFETSLLEGDRWLELVGGRLIRLEQPTEVHGNVVRNLAYLVGGHLASTVDWYPCFEQPLVINADRPLVRTPAVSCFRSTPRFGELDQLVSTNCPGLVIEVASTNDRREGMSTRVADYLDWGVAGIWVIDTQSRHVHQYHASQACRMLREVDQLAGSPLLEGFEIEVAALFREPSWAEVVVPNEPDDAF